MDERVPDENRKAEGLEQEQQPSDDKMAIRDIVILSAKKLEEYEQKVVSRLISLDLWRCRLTEEGLNEIADSCPELQELDVGWCPNLRLKTGSFTDPVKKCPNIKKLYLTANRTICNEDLIAISKHCPNLEQLDILGTSNVHRENVYSVLTSCRKLIFLDVSFCGNVDEDTINIWRSEFPQCSIKKSFQD
ncbi:uncharacterized protein LOC144621268 [Crassostrea virginica]